MKFSCNSGRTSALLMGCQVSACAELSLQERGMTREANTRRVWTKPYFKRLGEIKDVAGAQGAGAQGAGVKT